MEEYPSLVSKRYQDIRHDIRSGDILLCSGNSTFSTLIKKATRSVWSHVGFILRLDAIDRIMVLESVESIGVRTIALSSYIHDYNATQQGYPGRIVIARHRDVKENAITQLSKSAVDFLGYPYNKDEVIRIAARISLHSLGLLEPNIDKPEREFICSEYAHICFKSIGVNIAYNPLGFITPADFARDPHIKLLYYLQSEMLSTKITSANNNYSATSIASLMHHD